MFPKKYSLFEKLTNKLHAWINVRCCYVISYTKHILPNVKEKQILEGAFLKRSIPFSAAVNVWRPRALLVVPMTRCYGDHVTERNWVG